mmetsp:Transcript_2624/g.4040  ORF Transcript_2624/g.4040 Transcript_2624/m.4040 type:complete len:303 (+) Transcript_2624:112-1020(+)
MGDSEPRKNHSLGKSDDFDDSDRTKPIKKDTSQTPQAEVVVLDDVSSSMSSSMDEEEEEEYVDDEDDEVSWIQWYCGLKGNEFFAEVDEDFIEDNFNLCGLRGQVNLYDEAIAMILDRELPNPNLTDDQHQMVEASAEFLYGLIHARFILTSRGMSVMLEKFKNTDFGRCPRVLCQGQAAIPLGLSDIPRSKTVCVFCPRCEDVYHPRSSRAAQLDGAFFGTTFPHLLIMSYPEQFETKPKQTYVARIYGFRIHKPSGNENRSQEADRPSPSQRPDSASSQQSQLSQSQTTAANNNTTEVKV